MTDDDRDFADSPMLLEEALDGELCEYSALADTPRITNQMIARLCNPN